MPYYVYILSNNSNKVLYIGRTEDLIKRVFEHKSKLVKGFTEKYNLNKLVYYEIFDDKDEAAKREWRMKKWKREWKENVINAMNPDWLDLYSKLRETPQ